MAAREPKRALKFEEALDRLEKIVARLESDEATLDESIALFEEGRRLGQICATQLEAVEKKARILIEERSANPEAEPAIRSEPFEDEGDDDEGDDSDADDENT